MGTLKLIKFMFKEHKWFPILVICFSTATILSSVGLFGYSSYLIAFCALHPGMAAIMTTVVIIRVFGISRAAIRYVERYSSHDTTFKMIKSIRQWLYKRVIKIRYEEVVTLDKEEVLTHLMDDVESLQDFYLRTFNPFITALAVGLVGVVILSFFSGIIAVIFCLFYCITLVIIPFILWIYGKGLNSERETLSSEIKVKIMDFFQSFVDIITNSARGSRVGDIDELHLKSYGVEYKLALLKTLSAQLNLLVSNFALFFTLLIGAKLVSQGHLNGVLLPMLILIVFSLFEATLPVGELFHKLEIAKHSSENIFKLEELAEVESSVTKKQIKSLETIELESISFNYPKGGLSALEEISLSIKKGERIAIVGHSGSGKSTLIHILLSWFNAKGGIKYNGECVETLSSEGISSRMCLVAQKSYFFHTTVRNNLKMAREEASDEEMVEVLRKVGLERWFSRLANGLDSSVGENAMLLSGGERQRFAIARALLAKKDFLILDEVTAGLDVHMESKIIEMILNEFNETGLIMVTHRLTYMNSYDKIYVMRAGRIIESGTHESLLAQKGEYNTLYQVQTQIV